MILKMKLTNLENVKKNINISTIIIFFIIYSSSLAGLYLIHQSFIIKNYISNKHQIQMVQELYKSNLSEKLGIIASSTVFIDYLRSGIVTRKRLYYQFLPQMVSLKTKSIVGMDIIDSNGENIFNYGVSTNVNVTLRLCYLNQSLNSVIGDCKFLWKLYFDKEYLYEEIKNINQDIKSCVDCERYEIFKGDRFSNFPIKERSGYGMRLYIENDDYFFYTYFALMTIALLISAAWNWCKLGAIFKKYIEIPLKKITRNLKSDMQTNEEFSIEEIQFLSDEISSWKEKLSKMQAIEKALELGKIAAQLAHDIRSPLSALGMIIKNLQSIPEKYRVILNNSTQRISDIANNFLLRYKKPHFANTHAVSCEHVLTLIETILVEKRMQYLDSNIDFTLTENAESWKLFAFVNAIEFKRLISNLVNNSVEAIKGRGKIEINLYRINEIVTIEIMDNGCGIHADILPNIINGGLTVGKQNGSGLGILHALEAIQYWNGQFGIQSQVGKGTKVSILLPATNSFPAWFKANLSLKTNQTICILDDEKEIHDLWDMRLGDFSSCRVMHMYHLNELEEFLNNQENLKDKIIYLIDYELGRDIKNGIEIAKYLEICQSTILVTNRYDDSEVQLVACNLEIKIIPKKWVNHILIEVV